MKKLLIGAAGLVALLVAAALIVPSFINWNEYKSEIATEVEKRTGRTLVIGGDIRLTLLPAPAVVVTDLSLGNIEGGTAEDMLRLRSLAVSVAVGPLFQGRIQVENVRLVKPMLHLEVLADSRRNWEFSEPTTPDGDKKPAESGSGGGGNEDAGPSLTVQLDSLEIEDGVVVYRDEVAGTVERIDDLNANVAADSLSGPFEGEGEVTVRGVTTGFEVDIGRIDQKPAVPVRAVLTRNPGKVRLDLRGQAGQLASSPTFDGNLKLETADLAELAHAMKIDDFPGVLSQPLQLTGTVSASASRVDVTDLTARLGDTGATGTVSAQLNGDPAVSARLAIAHLNLDSWLEASASDRGAGSDKSDGSDTPSTDAAASDPQAPNSADTSARLPDDVTVSLAVSAEAITFRDGIVRDARLDAELAEGEITVSQISADMPGAAHVAAFGFITVPKGVPEFEGELDASAADARAFLGWLGVDTSSMPSGRLRTVDVKGKLAAAPGTVKLRDVDLRFDASRVTGRMALAMADRPRIDADVAIDGIDVDAYLPARGSASTDKGTSSPETTEAQRAPNGNNGGGAAMLTAFDARVKARVGRLIYRGIPFETVVLFGTLRDGVVDLGEVSVGNVAGASGRLAGTIEPLALKPGFDPLGFDANVPDLDRLLRALDLPRPYPVSTMGPFAITGMANGPFLSPTVEVTLIAAGGETKLSGEVNALPNPGFKGRVTLANVDLVQALKSLGVGYRPSGRIGPIDLSARLTADSSRISLSEIGGTIGDTALKGSVDVNLTGPSPVITADLNTGRLVIDPYLPADRRAQATPRLIPASWSRLPAPRPRGHVHIHMAADAPHRRWSRDALDLSVLQSMNADLSLKSEAILYDRAVLENVNAVVKLAGGVLTAEPLTGSLFSGPVQAKLRLDANGTPRVDGTLNVKNADLARVTRDANGRAVATGQMALNATIASRGISPADLVAALDGSGSLRMSNVEAGKGAAGGATASLINLLQQLNGIAAGFGVAGSRATVTATYRIDDGVIRTDDIVLSSGLGEGAAQGVIDLPRWHMDVGGKIRLRGNILTELVIETTGPPVMPFRIHGPVDEPDVNVDESALKIRELDISDP